MADVPLYQKTGTRAHSDVPLYQKPGRGYIRIFPCTQEPEQGHIRQNRPFTKPPLLPLEGWIRLVLTVLVFWSGVLLVPGTQLRLGASDCAHELASASWPLDICLDLLPTAYLYHPFKNGMHSTRFSSQGRHTWKDWERANVSHKRVFALLTLEIRGWKTAQMLQKLVFALPGRQQTSVNTLLCDTLGHTWKDRQKPANSEIAHWRGPPTTLAPL